MNSKDFKQRNKVYTAPASMPDCNPLSVYQKGDQIISFWEMDEVEKLALIVAGKVWIGIHAQIQPPVWLSTIPPFQTGILCNDIEFARQRCEEFADAKVMEILNEKIAIADYGVIETKAQAARLLKDFLMALYNFEQWAEKPEAEAEDAG